MGQFEYVRLIANLNRLPAVGEYDQALRREIVSSMVESGFYNEQAAAPDLIALNQPIWIGAEQMGGLPFYYWLASLPLRLIGHLDVFYQLYFLRLFSWLFFLGTVWLSAVSLRMIFPSPALSEWVTFFIAALPGFASKMVAVNDDVAAIFSLSLFIALSIWLITRGFQWGMAIGLIISALLCFYSKQTSWSALPLTGLVLMLAVFHRYKLWVWIVAGLGVAVGLVFFIAWDSPTPAYFYPQGSSGIPRLSKTSQTPFGANALFVGDSSHSFYQVVEPLHLQEWEGEPVTLGFWGWSSTAGSEQPFPALILDGQPLSADKTTFRLTETPTFYSETFHLPNSFRRSVLSVALKIEEADKPFYLDCFILVSGDQRDVPPDMGDPACETINWGSFHGENAIRNPSLEREWFGFRPFKTAGPIGGDERFLYKSMMGLFDPPASQQYITASAQYLFMTFWGRFGWGTIPYLGSHPYAIFWVITVLVPFGWLIVFIKKQPAIPWSTFLFLVIMGLIQIILVYLRYAGAWEQSVTLLPQARYFFPVIIPVSAILGIGWYALYRQVKLPHYRRELVFLSLIALEMLNVWAWITIGVYYSR